jgi:hypothetical protein
MPFYPPKMVPSWDNVEKYGTAGQATDDNIIWRMRIACWLTEATDTLRICNAYCFYMASTVTRTCLNVTLYVRLYYLSCVSRKEEQLLGSKPDHPLCYRACKQQVACHILTDHYFPARNTVSYCVDLGSFIFLRSTVMNVILLRFCNNLRQVGKWQS